MIEDPLKYLTIIKVLYICNQVINHQFRNQVTNRMLDQLYNDNKMAQLKNLG